MTWPTTFGDEADSGTLKTELNALLAGVQDLIGAADEAGVTIASGVITVSSAMLSVDTESAGAADDLANITVASGAEVRALVLRCTDAGRVVTLKHAAGGDGQLHLLNGGDAVLNDPEKTILLVKRGTDWHEASRNWGAYAEASLVYSTVSAAEASSIPDIAGYIAIAEFSPQPRFYKRFASDPGSGDRFQSADGAWWQGLYQAGFTGYVKGLTVANDTTTPATKFTVAAGAARDDADTVLMALPTGLLKRLNTAWSAGNDAGCLDTGSIANSTWYHVFLIYNPTTGASDILASISLTNPTLPSGYTRFRRIWSLHVNGSGEILPFVQVGDECRWKNTISTHTVSGVEDGGKVGRLRIVRTPPGIKTEAILLHFVTSALAFNVGVYDPDLGVGGNYYAITMANHAGENTAYVARCYTDVNSQVMSYSDTTNLADSVISIVGLGYVDTRGKRI